MTFSLQLARHRRRHSPGSGAPSGRRGFTMIELVTVLMLMGTMGRVAVPNVHELVLQARSQEVAGNLEIMHLAAVNYRQDKGAWPSDAYTGQVPPGLQPYLPEDFSLEGEGYRLDWENWLLPDGLPDDPDLGEILGMSVVTDDPALGRAVTDLLGGALDHYVLDDRYTFVLVHM